MPSYKPFALDHWGSAVQALTLAELQEFLPSKPILDSNVALTYGPTRGLPGLRQEIQGLYRGANGESPVETEDVLITAGAVDANHLFLESVIKPGDHVIIQYPIYGPLLEIPRSAGAEVSFWQWREGKSFSDWRLDIEDLKALIRPNTKLIMLNNPTNPTGFLLSREQLEQIIELARPHDTLIMCDEVFRYLHHDDAVPAPPSLHELGYANSVVTSSLSKAFALPGVRVGWVAVSSGLRDTVLRHIMRTRDYTTCTVSQIDQQVGAFALQDEVRKRILARSQEICRHNLRAIQHWAKQNSWAEFIDPQGAGTCTIRILGHDGDPVDDEAFARTLAEEESVCVAPAGLCFGQQADGQGETAFKGCFRVGIVTEAGMVEAGLDAIARVRERWPK